MGLAAPKELFERIRSFHVFRECTDDFVRAFAALAHVRNASRGTTLIREGQNVDQLHILSSGHVEVVVEGERVAVIDQPGDLMGEMSVLTSKPGSATLTAVSQVEYFSIFTDDLKQSLKGSQADFGLQLYRAIANVLSEKILRTNEKARGFEMANRELEGVNQTLEAKVKERTRDLESRNTELLASHRKLEELYSTKAMTFKKLNQLQTTCLTPLAQTLNQLSQSVNPSIRNQVDQAAQQVESSIKMLAPMSELYSTEQAIRSRRVLLLENDRKQQVIAKLALGGTGVKLDIASNRDEALALLGSGVKYDLAFVGSSLADAIPDLQTHAPNAKLVFMAASHVPSEIPSLKRHGAMVSNIVSRHPEDRTFTVKNIVTTVSKLISRDLFGLEKYLIWGVEVRERPVTASGERREAIEEMQEHFRNLGIRSALSDRAALVAEELLMNAIYDAPVGPDGKPLHNQKARTESVELKPDQQAELRYACDGMLAAVSVSDPFGGFRMKTLFDYLERNYSVSGSDVQEEGKGGAGRGLHQIIENSDLVVFNVRSGRKTEVIALFNLDSNAVDENAKPSFHFFSE